MWHAPAGHGDADLPIEGGRRHGLPQPLTPPPGGKAAHANDLSVVASGSTRPDEIVLTWADPDELAVNAPVDQDVGNPDFLDAAGIGNQGWWRTGMPVVKVGPYHGRSAVLPEDVVLTDGESRCARTGETVYCQLSRSGPVYRVATSAVSLVAVGR